MGRQRQQQQGRPVHPNLGQQQPGRAKQRRSVGRAAGRRRSAEGGAQQIPRAPKLGYRCIELPTIRRYPATGQVPTKISSLSGNCSVLQVLIRACLGAYNPARRPKKMIDTFIF